MPAITLTDLSLRSLKLPEKGQVTYWDANLPGFGVRVSQGGTKSFVVVYGANRQRHTIGRYPAINLKAARQEAKRLQAELVLGLHKKSSVTFAEAMDRYLSACQAKNKPGTYLEYKRILTRHFRFGRLQIRDISRAAIQRKLDKLKKTPSEQSHAFVALRAFFNWAVREELIDANPMANMGRIGKTASRERVLTDEELSRIIKAADSVPYPFGSIVTLLAFTGQRRGEIAGLKWDWIDFDAQTITLPADFTKNKRLHAFPFGDQVSEILKALPVTGDLLFLARSKSGRSFSGWSKSKARFDGTLEDVELYTLHDLRRTFSSNLARLGVPIHVTEKLLNHVSGTVSGVAAIYNRHSYMDEMKEAVAAYETFLAKITAK